jgi:hypothetical protein
VKPQELAASPPPRLAESWGDGPPARKRSPLPTCVTWACARLLVCCADHHHSHSIAISGAIDPLSAHPMLSVYPMVQRSPDSCHSLGMKACLFRS